MDEEQATTAEGPVKKTRTVAHQRWSDIPEVTSAPEGAVGHNEMAEILGVGRTALSNYQTREDFPKPVGRKGKSLFFDPKSVKEWHESRPVSTARAAARGSQLSQEREQRNLEALSSVESAPKTIRSNRPEFFTRMIPGTGSIADQIAVLNDQLGITRMAQTPEQKQKLSNQFDDLFFDS